MEDRPATQHPTRPFGTDPLHPPPCPDGWVTGAPDFVGVGAARCGTTWWFRQITGHPEVFFDSNLHTKEIHFFNGMRDFQRLPDHYADLYAQHFPRPPDAGRTGEWTPRYMLDPWVMRQLRQVAPATRILLMLRDPVARYASGYARLMAQERRSGGSQLPERVVELDVIRGFYVRQVRRVLEAFPRDSVLILQYERCCLDYESQLDRTWEFLGVEPGFRPPFSGGNLPRAQVNHAFLHSRRGRRLADAYAEDAARLVDVAPEIDLSLWPSVADLA
jgi:Sulfotransferase domain